LDRLPNILDPTDVVGQIRKTRAGEMGLPKPLPLVIGLNDGASATLATGALSHGDAIITLATNGVLRVIMDRAVATDLRLAHDLFNWPYLLPDRWIAGGQTKAGASALQWFARIVGDDSARALDELLAQAERSSIGCGGVIFLPYLMGRGSPHGDASATGTFAGMTLASSRGDLARAVLEGAAFALRDIRDDLTQFGLSPGALKLSGGGGRSALWRQIIADTLGQELAYYPSDSTLGAAIVAAVGLGFYRDFPSATRAMVHHPIRHAPIAANVERYRDAYAAFRRARDTLFPVGKTGPLTRVAPCD
jgi:xylulokinase